MAHRRRRHLVHCELVGITEGGVANLRHGIFETNRRNVSLKSISASCMEHPCVLTMIVSEPSTTWAAVKTWPLGEIRTASNTALWLRVRGREDCCS